MIINCYAKTMFYKNVEHMSELFFINGELSCANYDSRHTRYVSIVANIAYKRMWCDTLLQTKRHHHMVIWT